MSNLISNTIRNRKAKVLLRSLNNKPLNGIDPSLATVLIPKEDDLNICNIVSEEIIKFTKKNNPNVPNNLDLKEIHNYLDLNEIDNCSKYVRENLKKTLFDWSISYAEKRLGFNGNFYIDNEIYIRINFPYNTRFSAESSKRTHPNHRLAAYNRYLPKGLWAHGPHKDSWYGHSLNALNFWMAINELNEQNTMILYPEHAYQPTVYDSSTMYASYEEDLGRPIKFKLNKGENLLFDPELLHSTRINTSNQTRVVLTLRLCELTPQFAKDINHDTYDNWISSESIRKSKYIGKKISEYINISDISLDKKHQKSAQKTYCLSLNSPFKKVSENIDFFSDMKLNIVYKIIFSDEVKLCIKNPEKLTFFNEKCPHLGAPLEKCFYDSKEDSITCPAHGMAFSTKNGQCSSHEYSSINTKSFFLK